MFPVKFWWQYFTNLEKKKVGLFFFLQYKYPFMVNLHQTLQHAAQCCEPGIKTPYRYCIMKVQSNRLIVLE